MLMDRSKIVEALRYTAGAIHNSPDEDNQFPEKNIPYWPHLSVDFLSWKMLNGTKGFFTISR
jgi:hypothetical protein